MMWAFSRTPCKLDIISIYKYLSVIDTKNVNIYKIWLSEYVAFANGIAIRDLVYFHRIVFLITLNIIQVNDSSVFITL